MGTRSTRDEAAAETPLFSFGVIADVQYADIDNKQNYEKTAWRYYRESLEVLRRAVDKWQRAPVSFVLQLGDLVDGFNSQTGSSQAALDKTLQVLSGFTRGPVHHTWGNHELYNFSRHSLLCSPLNSNPAPGERTCSYYSVCPHPGFRVVVLDTFEVALLGYSEDSPEYKEALTLIQRYNKNEDLNSPNGLEAMERHFCKFNGGVGKQQLAWLDETLSKADKDNEHVIVMGHIAVCRESTSRICLLWNYTEVLAVLHRHRCVRAYLAGHDHDGGHAVDAAGVHHLTLRGVIEAAPGEDPSLTAHVYRDRLELFNLGPRSQPIHKVVIEL